MARSIMSVAQRRIVDQSMDAMKLVIDDLLPKNGRFEEQVDPSLELRRLRHLLDYVDSLMCTHNSEKLDRKLITCDEVLGSRSQPSGIVDCWKSIEICILNGDQKRVAKTQVEKLSCGRDSNPDWNTSPYRVFMSFRGSETPRDLDVLPNHYQFICGDRHFSKSKIDANDVFDGRNIALDILNGSTLGNEREKIEEMSPKEGSWRAKNLYNQFDQGDYREFPHSSACKSSTWLSTNENMSVKNLNYVFMLTSSFILATLNPPSGVFLEGSFHRMGYSKVQFVNKPIVIRSAVSVAWIISIISVISELQRDPYLLVSLAAIFLGYVGTILAIESPEALPMLKLGGLVLLLAAFMYLAFNRFPLRLWKWFCGRRRSNVDQPESVTCKTVNATDVDV